MQYLIDRSVWQLLEEVIDHVRTPPSKIRALLEDPDQDRQARFIPLSFSIFTVIYHCIN